MTPDLLIIGHVARDETPSGPKLGGTVAYAGAAAAALSAQVAVVTSAAQDEPVLHDMPSSIRFQCTPASSTTTFVNTYDGDRRRQFLLSRAALLTLADVPLAWRSAAVVHLGPLDDEVDPDLVKAFSGSMVAATPQGWMRAWCADGTVTSAPWRQAEWMLPLLDVTIFSEEDIGRDTALEQHYARLARLLIVTRAGSGCTIYQPSPNADITATDLPAPTVPVVDATGAGDVFAGVFLTMLLRTKDVMSAARTAVHLASMSITRPGLDGAPRPEEIRHALA